MSASHKGVSVLSFMVRLLVYLLSSGQVAVPNICSYCNKDKKYHYPPFSISRISLR